LTRYGKSDAEREEAKKTLLETALPAYCKRMLATIESNGPAGWLVGDQLTWADVYVAHALDVLEAASENCLSDYPKMKEFQQRVFGQPNLKEYLTKRGPLPKL
jgi:glutathione S-transferase